MLISMIFVCVCCVLVMMLCRFCLVVVSGMLCSVLFELSLMMMIDGLSCCSIVGNCVWLLFVVLLLMLVFVML